MKKIMSLILLLFIVSEFNAVQAQVFMRRGRGGMGRMYRQRRARQDEDLPKFIPSVNISAGFGFPNMDRDELPLLYNYYRGGVSQTGPLTASIDYQFNRSMSIGALVTHGKVSVPYYDNANSQAASLNGSLDNWSFMVNFMRYMPGSEKVMPYIRTAIGINSWQQNFTDANGAKININLVPGDLAYQVGIGAKFYLLKNAGCFVEAGYGKYILHGGLTFKF